MIGGSATLYLAAIMDLHARFIVGWALSTVNDRHLTLNALERAVKRRCPDTGLLHHSDQGCMYASEDYRTRLTQRHGIACSLSRRGNRFDNAVMESWVKLIEFCLLLGQQRGFGYLQLRGAGLQGSGDGFNVSKQFRVERDRQSRLIPVLETIVSGGRQRFAFWRNGFVRTDTTSATTDRGSG